MAETTKIEWADATLNPWWGCTKVSPGCANCYADALAHRWGKDVWGPGRAREDHREGARKLAMRLERQAVAEARPLRVFCASMADWLDPEVPAEWLADLLALVDQTPHLTWMLLTKRPQLWRERLSAAHTHETRCLEHDTDVSLGIEAWLRGRAPANVWVGTTVEDQQRADGRIPQLLAIPARVRFLSCEPLLGPLKLPAAFEMPSGRGWIGDAVSNGDPVTRFTERRIDWVIAGGESGHGARPMHPDWVRALRNQVTAAGAAFFFKQWGRVLQRARGAMPAGRARRPRGPHLREPRAGRRGRARARHRALAGPHAARGQGRRRAHARRADLGRGADAMRPVRAGGIIRASLDNTWQTPPEILERVRLYFGGAIRFDPATTQANPTGALKFCALAEPGAREAAPCLFPGVALPGDLVAPDGLSLPWDEPTWCNPPYGDQLRPWLLKFEAEAQRGTEIVALLPCKVLVHRVAVALEQNQAAFERELREQGQPRHVGGAQGGMVFDLRHVL